MPSTTLYRVILVVVASAAVVFGRPQNNDNSPFEVVPQPQFGTFIGEIVVHSPNVAVQRATKRPVTEKDDGPRAFRLVGDQVGEFRVDSNTGAEVPLASGSGLSISGSTITFSKPAEVVAIPAQ